jgi:hypothetical protein
MRTLVCRATTEPCNSSPTTSPGSGTGFFHGGVSGARSGRTSPTCWHNSRSPVRRSLTPWRPMRSDLGYREEEPSAGKPHARLREGESRMAELLDRFLRVRRDRVLDWIRRGELRAIDVSDGGKRPRYRITSTDLEQFLRGREASPQPLMKRRAPPNIEYEDFYVGP